MKKFKNYKDEIISTRTNVLLPIIAVPALASTIIIVKQFLDGEFGIGILLISLLLILPCFLLPVYGIFINIVNGKKNQEKAQRFINNGIKVNGKIINIVNQYEHEIEQPYFLNTGKNATYKDINGNGYNKIVIVEYEYLGEKHIAKSPSLNTDIIYNLASKDVDVYVYDNEVYIDNYKLDIKKIEKDKNDNKRSSKRLLLLFFTIIILFCIGFCLVIEEIISFKILTILVAGGMFGYIIAVIIKAKEQFDDKN